MADLRAKDADLELINRTHIAARLCGLTYSGFIIKVVADAVEHTEKLQYAAAKRRTPKEKPE
jgi:hypothetical protein